MLNKKHYLIGFMFFILLARCASPVNEEETAFNERAETIIEYTADHFIPPSFSIGDPEKFYWPKIMARFEKYGATDSLSNVWIEQLKHRSPFHFTLVGMARLMSLYGDAPAINNNKKLLLQRVFERTDAHNPWNSEGTENHLAMDRTSGYIFAQHALEFQDEFPQAQQKLELMKDWMLQWSKNMYSYGTGEWNSRTYQAYHIIGWLNLYDFAHDEEVKHIARAVLDYYAAEMALHYSWGSYGGSQKRGTGARDIDLSASAYMAWLWFDNGRQEFRKEGREYIQSMHAVTSSYRPPKQALHLARKEDMQGHWYLNSKPSYLFEVPSFVKQFFYVGNGFTLGTAVSPYGGFTGSTYQIMNWKLIVEPGHGELPKEISGNGRFHDNWTGLTGNPWTQFAQYKNVLVQLTRTPQNKHELIEKVREVTLQWAQDWQHDFSSRFPDDAKPNVVNFARNIVAENLSFVNLPADVSVMFRGNVGFADAGYAYLAVRFLNDYPDQENARKEGTRLILTDQAEDGELCGFVIEVFSSNEWESFGSFQDEYLKETSLEIQGNRIIYISFGGDYIEAAYTVEGFFTEAIYDWGFGATHPQTLITSPPFVQPVWPSGEGFGKLPFFRVNGEEYDFTEEWPVFNGPLLRIDEQKLTLGKPNAEYILDYRGDLPVFY